MTQNAIDVVATAQARSRSVREQFGSLLPSGDPWHPIPFFGPLNTASALTVAMNPSADEFRDRGWPLTMTAPDLTARLLGYFRHSAAPHPWFAKSELPLLPCHLRYGLNLAHLDIVCRATRTIKADDGPAFLRLAEQEDDTFFRCLDAAADARLVILTGSLTGRFYLHEYVARRGPSSGWTLSPKALRVPGGPFAGHYRLTKGSRTLPVFFASASVNRRGGPREYERLVLAHRDTIRGHLGFA